MYSSNEDPFEFKFFKQVFEENEDELVSNAPENVWAILLPLYNGKRFIPRMVLVDKDAGNSTRSARKFTYLLGRGKTCDFKLDVPTISNKHCIIYKIEDKNEELIYIEDTSSNGTFVNEKRIPKNKPWRLYDEDIIKISRENNKVKNDSATENVEFVIQFIKERKKHNIEFSKNYMVLKMLGKGAFAEVKLAINRITGEKVAVKVIDKTKVVEHKRLLTNFDSEKSILGRAKHPSIIRIRSIYHEERYYYVILDLAKGGELFDRIVEQGHFTEDESRVVLLQLLLGIRYLHKNGIVHRDIKPENILLSDYEGLRVQLADFGLAKIVGEQQFMKTLCGTPMYVAPEVLDSKSGRVYDSKVDMWSLGVVLYICVFGFPPFSDDLSPPPLKQQILKGIYEFPSPYCDRVSTDVQDLITRMLTVNPKHRISPDCALAHPWLRAIRNGNSWSIKGVYDFVFEEPEETSQETTQTFSNPNSSISAESQGWNSDIKAVYPQNCVSDEMDNEKADNVAGVDPNKETIAISSNGYHEYILKTAGLDCINNNKSNKNSLSRENAEFIEDLRQSLAKPSCYKQRSVSSKDLSAKLEDHYQIISENENPHNSQHRKSFSQSPNLDKLNVNISLSPSPPSHIHNENIQVEKVSNRNDSNLLELDVHNSSDFLFEASPSFFKNRNIDLERFSPLCSDSFVVTKRKFTNLSPRKNTNLSISQDIAQNSGEKVESLMDFDEGFDSQNFSPYFQHEAKKFKK